MISEFQGEYRWLSNFWAATVIYEGISYPSVEHAFQAAKTLDRHARKEIASDPNSAKAKQTGRRVQLRSDWEEIKLSVMYSLVLDKFTRNAELKKKLLATGDQELTEGNTWNDTIWGICNGKGENWLGKILMAVRGRLQ